MSRRGDRVTSAVPLDSYVQLTYPGTSPILTIGYRQSLCGSGGVVKMNLVQIYIVSTFAVDPVKLIYIECLLISSLPGKFLRTLVDIARLVEQTNT